MSFAQFSVHLRVCVRFGGFSLVAWLAALVHHGIILERCCYLCSVSKPIILTQIYVNTAVSWHRKRSARACTRTAEGII